MEASGNQFDIGEFLAGDNSGSELSDRILDAAFDCVLKWGMAKTTVDDVVDASGVSRATIYRLFPGGRDVMFEALRVRELGRNFAEIADAVAAGNDPIDAMARGVAAATEVLKTDPAVKAMMTFEPETMIDQLTATGLPRILMISKAVLGPTVSGTGDDIDADRVLDMLVRLTISYFLAPDPSLDLSDVDEARRFVCRIVRACGSDDERSTLTISPTRNQKTPAPASYPSAVAGNNNVIEGKKTT